MTVPCLVIRCSKQSKPPPLLSMHMLSSHLPPATHTAHLQVALLAACKRRGIPVLASAGAGAKADPTRLRILDVAESVADPLARSVRHR